MENISFHTTTRKNHPLQRGFFSDIKDTVVGKNYELSVVVVGTKLMRKLNREKRGIDKVTDILSFPLSKNSGEIFLNIPYAEKKSKIFNRTKKDYLNFLFIHGLLHLIGMDHGSKMENEEKKFCKQFGIK